MTRPIDRLSLATSYRTKARTVVFKKNKTLFLERLKKNLLSLPQKPFKT